MARKNYNKDKTLVLKDVRFASFDSNAQKTLQRGLVDSQAIFDLDRSNLNALNLT